MRSAGRLCGRYGPRRRHPWRPCRRQGHAGRHHGQAGSLTGAYLTGIEADSSARRAPQRQSASTEARSGAAATTCKTSRRHSRLAPLPASPAFGRRQVVACDRHALQSTARGRLHGAHPGAHDESTGWTFIDKVIDIDQSPIGRTPRSNPATYTGAFTPIREWFAGLPEAKARGYNRDAFRFNVKGGRCEACQGDGVIKIEMHFPARRLRHLRCLQGQRYNRETLEVKFSGKSIADVLDMTVEEGARSFSAVPSIRDKLVTLQRVGLGYIQSASRRRPFLAARRSASNWPRNCRARHRPDALHSR